MNTMFRLRHVLRAPAGEDGEDGGADRGDHFEPDGDDAPAAAAPAPAPARSAPGKEDAADETGETGETGEPAEGLSAGAPGAGTEAEAGAGDEDERGKAGPKIPLSRHKAMLDKARDREAALQRQIEELRHNKAVVTTNEQIGALDAKLPDLETKYNEALADGRTQDATKLMQEIREIERDAAELRSDLKVKAAEARAVEQVRFDTVVERIEAAYPQLDPTHESYDEALVAEVLELQRGYALQNYAPSKALQKAVSVLLKPATSKQETATTVTPRVDPADAAAKTAAERKAAAATKAASAAARQPASMKVGMDSDRAGGGIDAKSFSRLSQKQFAEIPDEQLARVRGDDL